MWWGAQGLAAGRRRRPVARSGGRQGATSLKADSAQGEHARVGAALRQAAEVHARQRGAQCRGRQAGRALVADVVDCARAHVSVAGNGGAAQNTQPQAQQPCSDSSGGACVQPSKCQAGAQAQGGGGALDQ